MRIRVPTQWLSRRFPTRLKNRLRTIPAVYLLRNAARKFKYSSASLDEIYDAQYFESVDKSTSQAAELVVNSIVERFSPKSAIDIGCGTGALLDTLRNRGVAAFGIDYSEHALKYCRERGIECRKMDLTRLEEEDPHLATYDVAICMEVGHQLPKESASSLVKLLTSVAPAVVFSSETPGTFDRLPLNEQPTAYWVELFQSNTFVLDQDTTQKWRELWSDAKLPEYFCRNVQVFTRSA